MTFEKVMILILLITNLCTIFWGMIERFLHEGAEERLKIEDKKYEEYKKKTKRLLKLALKDMNTLYEAGKDEGCVGIKFKWRYADETIALIGEENDDE